MQSSHVENTAQKLSEFSQLLFQSVIQLIPNKSWTLIKHPPKSLEKAFVGRIHSPIYNFLFPFSASQVGVRWCDMKDRFTILLLSLAQDTLISLLLYDQKVFHLWVFFLGHWHSWDDGKRFYFLPFTEASERSSHKESMLSVYIFCLFP